MNGLVADLEACTFAHIDGAPRLDSPISPASAAAKF